MSELNAARARLEEGEHVYRHPEFPSYALTDHGRVYSYIVGRFLRPITMGRYLGVQLRHVEGGTRKRYVHRLVLETVVRPCPEGMEARHLNGDRYDNRATNLAWGTPRENSADQARHGTTMHGTRNPMAKLTEAQVAHIRSLVRDGAVQRRVARQFNVSPMTVSRIVRGESWVGGAA